MSLSVSFILVSTLHAGNIGSTARALINMGFSDLRLVKPRCHADSADARMMAMAGQPLLKKAKIFDSVEEAIADCELVIGTACPRVYRKLKRLSSRELVPFVKGHKGVKRLGVLFGPEEKGLSNEDLSYCDAIITIPTLAKTPSMNLSQAVMVIAYELATLKKHKMISLREKPASKAHLNGMIGHLEEVLWKIHYMDPQNPFRNRLVLRSLFRRARPTESEIFHLRAIFRKFLTRLEQAEKK